MSGGGAGDDGGGEGGAGEQGDGGKECVSPPPEAHETLPRACSPDEDSPVASSPEPPPPAPSLLEALSGDFLACKICLEQLRSPKTLPCLHTYCQACLARLAAAGPLRCPECREPVALPPAGVSALRTNFFVNGLLDLLRARAGGRRPGAPGGCALCPLRGGGGGAIPGGGPEAAARCLDCADDLCAACADGHRCSRQTHAHRVVDLAGYRAGWYDEEARERQAARCPSHPGEALRFLCGPCGQLLCRECRLDAHLPHPCQPLGEAVRARRPGLERLLAGVERGLAGLAAARARERAGLARLRARAARVGAQVEAAAEAAQRALRAQRQAVLGGLRAHVEAAEEAARERLAELDAREQQARGAAAFARRVLGLGREAEILSLEGAIAQRLGQLQGVPAPSRPARRGLLGAMPRLELHPGLQDPDCVLLGLSFHEEEEDEEEEEGGGRRLPLDGAHAERHPPQEPDRPTEKDAGPPSPPEDGRDSPAFLTPEEEEDAPLKPLQVPAATLSPLPPPRRGPRKKRFRDRLKAPSPEPSLAGPPLPRPVPFACFPIRMPGDRRAPRITGLCPYGPREVLVADEQNRALKRFSLNGDYRGSVPVPEGCSPCSVAALDGAVAFSAGARLYLVSPAGEVLWRRALSLAQASHAVTAVPGRDRVAVSVAGHVEVYTLEGSLATRFVPGGKASRGQRALVFLAAGPQGHFVGSDWQQNSLVVCDAMGQVLGECGGPGLQGCQPGSVSVGARGHIFLTLRELNKVVVLDPRACPLGDFLTAYHGLEKPRVTTVVDGRFLVVSLSNGTIHVFKVRFPDG